MAFICAHRGAKNPKSHSDHRFVFVGVIQTAFLQREYKTSKTVSVFCLFRFYYFAFCFGLSSRNFDRFAGKWGGKFEFRNFDLMSSSVPTDNTPWLVAPGCIVQAGQASLISVQGAPQQQQPCWATWWPSGPSPCGSSCLRSSCYILVHGFMCCLASVSPFRGP